MFHSECHAAFTLPEHVVATDDFRRRDYATDLEIRSDLANMETRSNLEYPGDLAVPHKRTGTNGGHHTDSMLVGIGSQKPTLNLDDHQRVVAVIRFTLKRNLVFLGQRPKPSKGGCL